MDHLRVVLWLLGLVCSACVFAVELSEQADVEAKHAFKNVNFFSEGKGMIMSPGMIDMYDVFIPALGVVNREFMKRNWGVVFDDDNKLSGLYSENYAGFRVGGVTCAVCHTSRAAGQYIVGLGNKNIDVSRMAKDLKKIGVFWDLAKPDVLMTPEYLEVEDFARDFAEYLGEQTIGNLTQGLVPISFIRGWFYKIQGLPVPDMPRSQVKVPALWGYEEKRKVGQFCDGFGDGEEVGWAVAVELAAGQSPENVRRYYEKVKEAELTLEYFLPPKYPFEINLQRAETGRRLFEQTCARCHGTYETDAEGLPVYKAPRWIAWEDVMTDFDRLDGNRAEFVSLIRASPLSDIIRVKRDDYGYFAPRLEGIWSRFPYLHNASVPTVWDLLTPESERPDVFSLTNAGEEKRFDRQRLGLKIARSERQRKRMRRNARRGMRSLYTTKRVGHSNTGHNFYTSRFTESQKLDLIEYLKTL